ncbi:MAG: DUF2169 domain-containing protein, partial [Myxococcota bacterium]
MRTVKPQRLGVAHRVIEAYDGPRLMVTGTIAFSFEAPEVPLHEAAMWTAIAKELDAPDVVLDEGVVKTRPEVLVVGRAYPPGGQKAIGCEVRLLVGPDEEPLVDKRLLVVGDRQWQTHGASPPVPFREMPVTWARAYGGPDSKANPIGRGRIAVQDATGATIHALPNIEDPQGPVRSQHDEPRPVGFAPLDVRMAVRQHYAGTYDEAWANDVAPALPQDFDWHFFNLAPPDQWLNRPWQAGDRFAVENMHPEHARLEGEIPSFKVRAWITRVDDPDKALNEVPLTLDTVMLLPGAALAIAYHRGQLPVLHDDAADIDHLLLAAEAPSHEKPLEHYRQVFKKRTEGEYRGIYAMKDEDLLPPFPEDFDVMGLSELEGPGDVLGSENAYASNVQRHLQDKQATTRAEVEASGAEVPPL